MEAAVEGRAVCLRVEPGEVVAEGEEEGLYVCTDCAKKLGVNPDASDPGDSPGDPLTAGAGFAADQHRRIRFQPDPLIQTIVAGWPGWFDPERGLELGFKADADVATIIRAFIEDDLPSRGTA